jgi:hypothetical protein
LYDAVLVGVELFEEVPPHPASAQVSAAIASEQPAAM